MSACLYNPLWYDCESMQCADCPDRRCDLCGAELGNGDYHDERCLRFMPDPEDEAP